MPGELLQQVLEPLLISSSLPQRDFAEGAMNLGQQGYNQMEKLLIGGIGAYLLVSRTMHKGGHSGGQPKPAEVREARARVVEPWESGLLRIGGSLYKSVPLLDKNGEQIVIKHKPLTGDNGEQIIIEDEPLFTKKFHKLITPGTNGLLNFLLIQRKMVLVNNLPERTPFDHTTFRNVNKDVFTLLGGMTWSHVKALDENGNKMVYAFREESPDGKRAAGSIQVEQALLNAIMAAPSRAEAAGQLEQITRPEIVKRLKLESDPDAAAQEPGFFNEIENAVHDRFLERGSVLTLLGVNASLSQEKEAAETLAKPMKQRNKILKGTSKRVKIGEEDTEDDKTAAVAAHTLHQEDPTKAPGTYSSDLATER